MTIAIRPLARDEGTLIGRIIATAFADDPVNLWTFNGTAAMRPAFSAMARHCYLKRGFGHVTEDGLAGTLWLRPGGTKGYGLGNLELGSAILRHGGMTALRRGMALDAALTKGHPQEDHYYLFAIGVDPSLQGKGIGGRLMAEAFREIDASGKPAYLESSKPENIPFYQNHGFRVLDEVIPTSGCPPMWLMWREAR